MADKIGRRKVMIATVLNFSLATGAMALTPDGAWVYLSICRLLVGLGVTGLYSVDITMVQEFVPASKSNLCRFINPKAMRGKVPKLRQRAPNCHFGRLPRSRDGFPFHCRRT